jgi:hypothetical protein
MKSQQIQAEKTKNPIIYYGVKYLQAAVLA